MFGLEKEKIFCDDQVHDAFLEQRGAILYDSKTAGILSQIHSLFSGNSKGENGETHNNLFLPSAIDAHFSVVPGYCSPLAAPTRVNYETGHAR
jgi:hypothetical protein